MKIEVIGNISDEEKERLIQEEKERYSKKGKEIAKIVLRDLGDQIEIQTYESSPIKRVRRITGYLAPTDTWNASKQAELRERIRHTNLEAIMNKCSKTGVTLRVNGLVYESVTDGPGLRDVLFVQGCPHHCRGCHNPGSWDFDRGTEVDVGDVLASLPSSPLISGITFSGGEPFCQAGILVKIARHVKKYDLNLWIYTGYTWEELLSHDDPVVQQLLRFADVVVDGRFVQGQADIALPFRGSANQRIIDVRKTFLSGKVVLWEPGTVDLPEPVKI